MNSSNYRAYVKEQAGYSNNTKLLDRIAELEAIIANKDAYIAKLENAINGLNVNEVDDRK